MSIYYIYGLIDPRSHMIRYVGGSSKPTVRLNQHINDATSKTFRRRSSTNQWIQELDNVGLRPRLVYLEALVTTDVQRRSEIEGEWIWYLRDNGLPLLNRYPVRRFWYHHDRSEILKSAKSWCIYVILPIAL